MSVGDFRPTRFLEIAQRVVTCHPVKRSARESDVATDEIEWLKTELARRTPDQVESFAVSLRPRQVRAAVALLTDAQVHSQANQVIRCRPRASLFETVWARVRREYPERRLQLALRFLDAACDHDELQRVFPLAQRVHRWLGFDRLALGVANEWEKEHGISRALDDWLEEFDIRPGDVLHSATIHEFLVGAKADTLQGIGAGDYLRLFNDCPIEVRAQAMARYLNVLAERARWDTTVLEAFESSFGVPQGGDVQNKYWSVVKTDPRIEFRAWSMGRQVERYFSQFVDRTGRGAFWRPFVEKSAVDFHLRCPSGPQEFLAIGIEFRNFGVVEFGRVGNAAYFYPIDAYRALVVNQRGDEPRFKDRQRTIRRIGNEAIEGRLIHQPGWQEVWQRRVEQLVQGGR